MKAKVDKDTCTGCELCVEVCPEVFKMGDEDTAVAHVETVPVEAEAKCGDAAEQCPVEAIEIE